MKCLMNKFIQTKNLLGIASDLNINFKRQTDENKLFIAL